MGGAGTCSHLLLMMTCSRGLLYRLAFPLCSAHGRGATVHYGFLRASWFLVTYNVFG